MNQPTPTPDSADAEQTVERAPISEPQSLAPPPPRSTPTLDDLLLFAATERFSQIMFSHPVYRSVLPLLKRIERCIFWKLIRINFPDMKNWYDASHRMPERLYPWSCTTEEGIVMMGAIIENKLQNGYEIATAFGHSALFIGSAFKKVGGRLVTIDCYVEENMNDSRYTPEELMSSAHVTRANVAAGHLPLGLRTAQENAAILGLDNVDYVVGLSPQDVDANIHGELDFVFIDGGHFGDQPTIDFDAIKNKMAERFVIFFHDNHDSPPVMRAVKAAEQHFGVEAIETWSHWNLTAIAKGISTDFIETFIRTRA